MNKKQIFFSLILLLLASSCVKTDKDPIDRGGEEVVAFTHANMAGKWEVFYNLKLVKTGPTVEEALGTEYRYTDQEGASIEFYDGGKVDGNSNIGRFIERNAFDKITQEGKYELTVKSGAMLTDSITYHFKSPTTGKDTITGFHIPGLYDKYWVRYNEYWQAKNKSGNIKYFVADSHYYRNIDKDANFQLDAKSKNLLNEANLIGDWQLSNFGLSVNGNWNYNVAEQVAQYGQTIRLNEDGTYLEYTKEGYNSNPKISLEGICKYKIVDDVIQFVRETKNALGKDTIISSKLWIKDPMRTTASKQIQFINYDKYRAPDNKDNVIEFQGRYNKVK